MSCCQPKFGFFSRPFSLCTLLSFFVTIIPTIAMVVAEIIDFDDQCYSSNLKIHLLIQGINSSINFIFCLYLMQQYSNKQQDNQSQGQPNAGSHNNGQEEKGILHRTINLIKYNHWVKLFICLQIFFLVWTSIGLAPIANQLNHGNECLYILITDLYSVFFMWGFMMAAPIVYILTLIYNACQDDSCTLKNTQRCLIVCCACGCYDPEKQGSNQNQSNFIIGNDRENALKQIQMHQMQTNPEKILYEPQWETKPFINQQQQLQLQQMPSQPQTNYYDQQQQQQFPQHKVEPSGQKYHQQPK